MNRVSKIIKKMVIPVILVCSMCASIIAYAASSLDAATKQEYYKIYAKIVNEISQESGKEVGLLPMDDFRDEDWKTPEEFRKFVSQLVYGQLVVVDLPNTRSGSSAAKKVTITEDGTPFSISITGKFATQYNSSTGRQHFSGVTSLTSKSSGSGDWKQISYDADFIDAARTCYIIVSGKLTVSGVYTTKYASVYFYCGSNGCIR